MIRLSELTKDYYSTGEVSRMLNLNPKTAYFWCCRGTIEFFRIPGGDYAIPRSEVIRLLKEKGLAAEEKQRKDIIYARFPSYSREYQEDLDEEVAKVLLKALPYKLFEPDVVREVGSGIKSRRKGLIKLTKMAANNEIGRIFISSKDQLSDFGFDYLKAYFNLCGTEIIVVNETPTPNQVTNHITTLIGAICDRLGSISLDEKEVLRNQIESLTIQEQEAKSEKKS